MWHRRPIAVLALVLCAGATALPAASAAAPPLAAPAGATAALRPGAASPAALPAATAWTPIPSYAYAVHDEPVTYRNGCHARVSVTVPHPCTFTHPNGAKTVLLFGDSHAAHWHAAVLQTAWKHGWRMLTMTKSGCPAPDVLVRRYKASASYYQCPVWRRAALAGLAAQRWGRIDLVVVSSWNFHQVISSHGTLVTGATRTHMWEMGWRRTLAQLLRKAKHVVILRDSPDLPGDATTAQACYRRWGLAAQTRCGAPKSRATSTALWRAERAAAQAFPGRVTAVDLTSATCPNDWCGPIDKPYLRFKDDNHWNQTYMKAHFTAPVDQALNTAMRVAFGVTPA
ncbi:MAG: hypothetical protein GC157_15675 [Frankiales bacterium]|nr:hypothetical protein [Frankiales bacterium]